MNEQINEPLVDNEKNYQNTSNENSDIEIDIKEKIHPLLVATISSIPGKTLQDKLTYLSYCNCCQRHQLLKPTKLAPWIDTPFNNTQNTFCQCDCRHIARFICRQVQK